MNIEDLEKKSIKELRDLARVLGITPGTLSKSAIIEKIVHPESQEETTDDSTKKRGRKPKNNVKAEVVSIPAQKTSDETSVSVDAEEKKDDQEEPEKIEDEISDNSKEYDNDSSNNEVSGIVEVLNEGYGFLRIDGFYSNPKDLFVAPPMIKRFGLRTGDKIVGIARPQKKYDEKAQTTRDNLAFIKTINGKPCTQIWGRPHFEKLTPIYPDSMLRLESKSNDFSTRFIDIFAPIGKGQRGLIVSPPKAGKTMLLKSIANSISTNYPDVCLIVLLIDERPEEVTDIEENVNGTVISSTFDELPERHTKVAELCLQHAERLVECGKDVVILMDSITRLARAYNMTITPTGRSLSGGLDPGALYGPKKFFGAARNIRDGGSLTIVATALVDTGSRLDDVIYEEFKGTGNMELHLDRDLAEKRIFPAIDVKKSGTRREDLLLEAYELDFEYFLRKALGRFQPEDGMDSLLKAMEKFKTNKIYYENKKDKIAEQK